MKDKRKIIFCFICIIITIFFEIFLYDKAYKEDQEYKRNMKKFLTPITTEIEARGFICKEDKKKMISNGKLKVERNSEDGDYGNIEIDYNLKGEINDIKILLEYSIESYSDDIFSDVYYVLNLAGIDLYEEQYMEALNILIETPSKNSDIDDQISKSEILINEKKYTFSLKRIKNENGEKKIQFCLE